MGRPVHLVRHGQSERNTRRLLDTCSQSPTWRSPGAGETSAAVADRMAAALDGTSHSGITVLASAR